MKTLKQPHSKDVHSCQRNPSHLLRELACNSGTNTNIRERDTKCHGDWFALDKAARDWIYRLNIDV